MDLDTLSATLTLSLAVGATSVICFSLLNKQDKALRWWAIAEALIATSGIVFWIFSATSPSAHTLLYSFFVFSLLGILVFFNINRNLLLPALISIVGYGAIAFWLSYAYEPGYRVAFSMSVYLIAGMLCGCLLLYFSFLHKSSIGKLIGVYFVLRSSVFVLRIYTAFAGPEWTHNALVLLYLDGIAASIIFPIGFVLIVSEKLFKEKEYEAYRDPLTQTLNRRAFYLAAEPTLQRCLRHKETIAVLEIDIDHFKAINDQYGHAIGDQVLKRCAEYLQRNTRDGDVLARFGGEEFILVMPNTDMSVAKAKADRLREGYADLIQNDPNLALRSTFSVGAYCHQGGKIKLDQLILKADDLLYEAKLMGRNCVVSAVS